MTLTLHFQRLEALFRKQGIVVELLSTDVEACGTAHEMGISPFPELGRSALSTRYLHEKIGRRVYRRRHWI